MIKFRTKGKGKNRKVYPISGSKKEYRHEFTVDRKGYDRKPYTRKDGTKVSGAELIKKVFVMGSIQVVPMAREIYIGYTTANLIYSSWKTIYDAYKNPETLKQEEPYGIVRDEVKTGLTSHQTSIIWNNIEEKVPGSIKHEAHEYLTNLMPNITEEEISLVENALIAF